MRIGKPLEPARHELAPGVFFTLKPVSSLLLLQAEAKVRQEIAQIIQGGERMAAWGFEINGDVIGTEKDWASLLAGYSIFIGACILAELLLVDWEGIEDENGDPMPLTLDAIRQAFQYGEEGRPMILLEPFLRLTEGPRFKQAAEKNV
jgi:hypothetical protein